MVWGFLSFFYLSLISSDITNLMPLSPRAFKFSKQPSQTTSIDLPQNNRMAPSSLQLERRAEILARDGSMSVTSPSGFPL